jgi:hypothetical protein
VYIQRSSEDLHDDMIVVKAEADLFIDGTMGTKECGLSELAQVLAA